MSGRRLAFGATCRAGVHEKGAERPIDLKRNAALIKEAKGLSRAGPRWARQWQLWNALRGSTLGHAGEVLRPLHQREGQRR
jgi:hypothetical protein